MPFCSTRISYLHILENQCKCSWPIRENIRYLISQILEIFDSGAFLEVGEDTKTRYPDFGRKSVEYSLSEEYLMDIPQIFTIRKLYIEFWISGGYPDVRYNFHQSVPLTYMYTYTTD